MDKIKPKRPRSKEWKPIPCAVDGAEAWMHPSRRLIVISSVDATGDDGELEHHLSLSSAVDPGPTADDVRLVLEHFWMQDAEEDNPTPSVTRNFWLPAPRGETVH